MIRYALKCPDDHSFESWFRSADAFEALLSGGHVACPVCGTPDVEKAIMAPQVRPSRKAATAEAPVPATQPRQQRPTQSNEKPLSRPASVAEQALAELRRKVETESDYVGGKFVSEARKMHLGEAPERSIYGEAKLEDAKKLLEDGIPVAPLPFVPQRKTN